MSLFLVVIEATARLAFTRHVNAWHGKLLNTTCALIESSGHADAIAREFQGVTGGRSDRLPG